MADTIPVWDARKVAEYFIWKSQQEHKPVTNKKLQKLLYYSQAWNLTLHKQKLFEQDVEAWVHGPAVRDVYLEYKNFGFDPIVKEVDPNALKFADAQVRLLEQIWDIYGKYDAAYLELLSHSEKPWQDARAGLEPDMSSDKVIEPESMVAFYTEKLKEAQTTG